MGWNPIRRRRGRAMLRVACGLLALPDDEHYVFPLTMRIGLGPGSVYPTLAQLEGRGWVATGWEKNVPEGRHARRWYRLTELGKRELTQLVRLPGYDIAALERLAEELS